MADVPSEGRKRRISITKLQRQTAAGADLISLCQTITEDGHLSDEEVTALRQWVNDNASCDLPAQEFLLKTVSRIIEDGKVTDEERSELYRAIEKVLPPDIREVVSGTRRSMEDAAEATARSQQDAERQFEHEAKQRNRPVRSWNFMVAGCRYEGRPEVIHRFAVPGDRAYLARDRENRFSRNAVEVRLENGSQAGYVPEELAVEVAPLLDQGLPHTAVLTKVLTGGRSPIPVVQARVFRVDASVANLTFERNLPAKPIVPPTVHPEAQVGPGGCLPVLLLVGALLLVASLIIAAVEP
jgi:HIRAN domain-containing protein